MSLMNRKALQHLPRLMKFIIKKAWYGSTFENFYGLAQRQYYGQSAIYGGLLVLQWSALPINFLGTGILYLFIRQVQIASLGGMLLLIPWFWYFRQDTFGIWYAVICSIAYGIRILPDFRSFREKQRQASKDTM